ncbi:hypothetical protein CC80DRAFT_589468 [Byssothecium circinans]|uniref:C2H2-type domain-containing protein n=1 Tax=Byssothecium circinans TaxID=147558 RepID=A0A6A5UA09_9PLEO|nr:hypothetical protein CC80DRAFT_589468 [Byssothecium circinans]
MTWYRAIPKGFWQRPLNFDLHATTNGELRIPFARYIRPSESTCSPDAAFPQFSNLPVELQLRVLQSCDSPTLSQLMQTSSFLRTEAKKLLFSDPEVWYCVDAKWLLEGGYPGDALHDMTFLAYVQRLDIHFHPMSHRTWMDAEVVDTWDLYDFYGEKAVAESAGGMNEHIHDFWRRLQHLFPNTTHVMLSEDQQQEVDKFPPIMHKKVAQMCPPNISVSLSFLSQVKEDNGLRHESRLGRTLWQQVHEWEECPTQFQPRILLPPKVFYGPVGAYQNFVHKFSSVRRQQDAADVLAIMAIERHHFYGRKIHLYCSDPDCNACFEQPEEYTMHIIRTGHHYSAPEPLKDLFSENEKRLERLAKEQREMIFEISEEWGEYTSERSEKWLAAEAAFRYQPENDPVDNKYPECCCDVWSMLYSYSFRAKTRLDTRIPGQEEILDCLRSIAHKYHLYKYIRFNTSVESATWDDASCGKDAEFTPEYTIECDSLVSAVGQLNQSRYPDIEELEKFWGKVMRSARWDWSYNSEGRRIGVIRKYPQPLRSMGEKFLPNYALGCKRVINSGDYYPPSRIQKRPWKRTRLSEWWMENGVEVDDGNGGTKVHEHDLLIHPGHRLPHRGILVPAEN